MKEFPDTISPCASANGFPCSAVNSVARSSAWVTHRLYQARNNIDLSLAVVSLHVLNASLAACTAVVTSLASISGTSPITDPVIGFVTENVAPDSAPTHFPFTYALSFWRAKDDIILKFSFPLMMSLLTLLTALIAILGISHKNELYLL